MSLHFCNIIFFLFLGKKKKILWMYSQATLKETYNKSRFSILFSVDLRQKARNRACRPASCFLFFISLCF